MAERVKSTKEAQGSGGPGQEDKAPLKDQTDAEVVKGKASEPDDGNPPKGDAGQADDDPGDPGDAGDQGDEGDQGDNGSKNDPSAPAEAKGAAEEGAAKAPALRGPKAKAKKEAEPIPEGMDAVLESPASFGIWIGGIVHRFEKGRTLLTEEQHEACQLDDYVRDNGAEITYRKKVKKAK